MPRTFCLTLLIATLALAAPARAQWEPLALPPALGPSQVAIFGFVVAIGDHVFAHDGFGVFDPSVGVIHYLYVSHDRGTTWAPDPAFTVPASVGARLGYPASADGALYLPFTRLGTVQTVARTTDGLRWTFPAGAGIPQDANARLLGVARHQGALYLTHGSTFTGGLATVYRSADDGATWAAVAPPRQMGFLWSAGSRLLIGQGPQSTTVGERSADGGVTWTPFIATEGTFPAPRQIPDAALAGGIAAANGLRSADGGTTWRNAPVGGRSVAGCGTAFVSASPTSSAVNTISISTDGGLTAGPWTGGLPAGEAVWQVACSNEATGTAGGTAYAAGQAALYRRDLSQATAGEAVPGAVRLALAVGPNPVRGAATLRLTLAEAASARVSVVDALGRTVLRLDRVLTAGAQTLALDVSGLAPGVYVARVAAGAAVSSVRFTVAR